MDDFIDHLDMKSGPVYYIQKQNSNLSEEYPELMNDIRMDSFDFAKQVFNKEPDAINFWFGDERAVTSSKIKIIVSSSIFFTIDSITILFSA